MFACSRCVDKATQPDDLPSPGVCLAEAVQLCRQDPANVSRVIKHTVGKLKSPSVMVRIKALRLLNHLATNGSSSCQSEIKLYSAQISDTIGWRGPPHPTRGYEPYQEMKDTAQGLLDMAFAVQAPTVNSIGIGNSNTSQPVARIGGVNFMESAGSDVVYTQAPSLEPRNLDPNARNYTQEAKNLFKKIIGKPTGPAGPNIYGSMNSQGTGSTGYGYQPNAYPPGGYPQTTYPPGGGPAYQQQSPYGQQQYQQPTYQPQQNAYQQPATTTSYQPTYNQEPQQQVYIPPPPQRGLLTRLENDVSFNKKKNQAPIAQKKDASDTPAGKFLKVSGNRALPTNGEINQFKAGLSQEQIPELFRGLDHNDWKVKVRAITGLEMAGQQFGLETVARCKNDVAQLTAAPQQSLRNAATRFYNSIQNVQPVYTGPPPVNEQEGFDFATADETAAPPEENEASGFDFGQEEGSNENAPAEEGAEEKEETTEEAAPEEAPAEENHVDEEGEKEE